MVKHLIYNKIILMMYNGESNRKIRLKIGKRIHSSVLKCLRKEYEMYTFILKQDIHKVIENSDIKNLRNNLIASVFQKVVAYSHTQCVKALLVVLTELYYEPDDTVLLYRKSIMKRLSKKEIVALVG